MRFRFLFYIILLLSIVACRKETFLKDKNVKLAFSADTVLFDTVFTTIGTTTLQFKAYNTYSKPLLTNIYVANGKNSNFRINVDGKSGYIFEQVEIAAKDSIYIFVEATIDPTNNNSPLVVLDSIIFETNDNQQDVKLAAWGQDVHLINGEIIKNDTIWNNDKPYLIYNSMLLDTLQTLTINEGVQIYLHKNSSIYIKGTLKVAGTKDNPVVFQGDRLEAWYDDIPGQWGHIRLLPGSIDNEIDYAIIKNGIIGIQVDTFMTVPALKLSNTIIQNMNAVALYTQGSTVLSWNCVFANCGQYCVALTIGGSYAFYHCTIANYWGFSNRTTPALVVNNYYQDITNTLQIRPLDVLFGNCIISGSAENEIVLDEFPGYSNYFTYKFDYALLKIKQSEFSLSDTSKFKSIILNNNPNFASTSEKLDFSLDTLSPAKDKGKFEYANYDNNIYNINTLKDIKGDDRNLDNGPDLGAYERIE
ncbi:MAG: hypothetical protein A2046_02855 [Bacteroidetes bacterium GWA2_30_7]|nr:MAG: hypothetical protein A2046_02855 [Bacteroidetes bacterium GWA2_30_7]